MSAEKASLRGLAREFIRAFTQTDDGSWFVRAEHWGNGSGSAVWALLRGLHAEGSPHLISQAQLRALLVALRDMEAGRRAVTSTGHTARGFLLGILAEKVRNEAAYQRTLNGPHKGIAGQRETWS